MELNDLLATSEQLRDSDWEAAFLHSLPAATVEVLSPDPQSGPDGWPYLMVATSKQDGEPMAKVLDWLSLKGIGLVVNPNKEFPDYVFSYGMIWNYRETGKLISPTPTLAGPSAAATEKLEFSKKDIVLAGTPSPQFLPEYVRQILREFFRDQGLLQPRILVLSRDGVNFDIAFSLESLGNPAQAEIPGVAEALSWFLPSHYSLMIISEKDLPPFGPI